MSAYTYRLSPVQSLLGHFPAYQPLVQDIDDNSKSSIDEDEAMELATQARIRSGDYFITLATELDKLAQSLNVVGAPEVPELELLVSELMYVHSKYELRLK